MVLTQYTLWFPDIYHLWVFFKKNINGKNSTFPFMGLVMGFSIKTIKKNTDVFLEIFPVNATMIHQKQKQWKLADDTLHVALLTNERDFDAKFTEFITAIGTLRNNSSKIG